MRDVSRPKYASSGRSLTTISPSPGWRRTRATDDFRLPVAQMTEERSGLIFPSLSTLGERDGLLCPMRMIRPGVDLELRGELPSEAVLRQHADDRFAHEARRALREHLFRARAPDAARVARVADVLLLRELLPREPDFRRVDHDDEIARVEMGREARVFLAAEHAGDARREPAEHLAVGIGDVPAPRGTCRLGAEPPRGVRQRH